MRLHRIVLTHVKGVADREIVFPDSGIVVVEGENEAGKTTMIEALDLLFEEKDSSKKRHVLTMRPVGLDVSSAVEAEISSGPYRFTYRKQWFRKPSTVLTVHAPRREQLTGAAAHDRVREILEETTDADLWRAMRLMQATPLTATDLSGSTALSAALDEAAGQAGSAGGEGDSILEAAEGVYREFFTATGRPTGEYREAETRLDAARAARDEAAAAVREVADDVARHTTAVHELDRLAAQLEAGEATEAELQEQWEVAQRVVREAEHLATRTAMARQAYESALDTARRREELVAEIDGFDRALAEAEAELERCRAEVDPGQERLTAALDAAERARAQQREARRAASGAESDIALVADLADLTVLAGRLSRLDEVVDARRAAREAARGARFEASLPRLEAAERAVEIARAEWRAGSPTWRVVPLAEGETVLVDGEETTLAEAVDGVVGATTSLEVPGRVRIEIEPAAGAVDRAEVVARAEAELADLLAAAGVADLAAARAAAERASDLEARCAEVEAQVGAVLGGSDVDSLRERGDQLLAHVVELVARRLDAQREARAVRGAATTSDEPSAAVNDAAVAGDVEEDVDGLDEGDVVLATLRDSVPADVDEALTGRVVAWILATADADHPDEAVPADDAPERVLRAVASRARAREKAVEEEIAAAEAEIEVLRTAVEAARLRAARAEVGVESARSGLTEATQRLTTARERESDEALAARVVDTQAALGEARARESDVAAEVDRYDPDSLRVRLEGASAAAASLRRRFGQARDERLEIEARLRHAGEQGRAERLTEAESAVARAERTLAGLRRRAEAARTLVEALTRHRDEVRSAYVEPFGRAVSRLGRVVYGPEFDVEIGPGLTIDARLIGEERIPYEALSSGAKEQMSILSRLACASLVDPEQGAPVILDDAMGYSDPGRLQRVCSAFSLVGGDAQIILLTCTPGRYAAIPDAHVIQV
ncbi:AAA family ATPase [Mobilicoccus pelagius]|uniref:YhaN AAA domain-containing protein n=1 Tax=Mobilicoccus pelagius NBRC 104925 TaxID=1089455 RepID=H5UTC0_9MICO|nr:AAA family ATPase [Mobilicoccus pelagius]GAB48978.1 hypothetical protein MOPEL_091_00230 [Mobilicoccus pelagius NBRC 104925]